MRTLTTTFVLIILSGCASNAPLQPQPAEQASQRISQIPAAAPHAGGNIARHALSMVGTPYLYGGSAPETGFDCSGLVYYSYGQGGISVPRTSREQFSRARKISLSDASLGDLLFFQDQEKLSHVGIYIGERRFVHAPASGRTVSIASLDNPYYQMHLVGVGTLLP